MPSIVALVRDETIANVIVVGDGLPAGWLDEYVADNGYERAIDASTLAQPPHIGYVYQRGAGYVPPEELTASPTSIPPDGATASTVVYVDRRANPPASIEADVNGVTQTMQLAGGTGHLPVASRTPGDRITVRVGGVTVTIDVEES